MKTVEEIMCSPIEKAVKILKAKDGKIVSSEISDPHFREIKIVFSNIEKKDLEGCLEIENIEMKDSFLFCNCHLSTIRTNH